MATSKTINSLNLFQEGKFAHGYSFVGRKDLLSELMQHWIQSGGNGNRSVVGLNRMGKNSLVYEFCERIKKNEPDAICIMVSLGQHT